ncbi:MAG: CPBP family intramembrane metalloprotease [Saprospiraceae bacterium]|nr:CPBP family intramembrane metalloprotease [Saprospiraceae bacterium]MCB9327884.1 CPBP family intramembrane metalloprotease [Lewinellaceae bacterium]
MLKKAILLISAILICVFLGNAVLVTGLLIKGLSLNEIMDLNISEIVNSDSINANYFKLLVGLSNLISFAGSAVLYLTFTKKKEFAKELDLQPQTDMISLVWFVALYFCTLPLASLMAEFSMNIPWPDWMQKMDDSSLSDLSSILVMHNAGDLMVNLISIAMIAGFSEELLFRGVIQKGLQEFFKPSWIAIIVSSIIFSAVHLQPVAFLPKMVIGLLLGYAYWISRNLWYSIALHTLNNAVPLIVLYYSGIDASELPQDNSANQISWLSILVSIALGINIIFAINKRFNGPKT